MEGGIDYCRRKVNLVRDKMEQLSSLIKQRQVGRAQRPAAAAACAARCSSRHSSLTIVGLNEICLCLLLWACCFIFERGHPS